VVAEKRLLLWDEPNVLVLHVKRFSYDGAKLGAHLAFSTQLNLVPYMCPRRLAARRTEAHVQHRSGARRLVSPQVAAAGGGAAGAAGARAGAAAAAPTAGCGSPQYELVGLVVHRGGSLSSGHYVAYVKDGLPPSGYWHCCDDTQVTGYCRLRNTMHCMHCMECIE
jgi:ubiquitin C-terminal hydrolase